ncbi:hypothetical protein [Aurantiacibacter sp. MUD61]|uniref:hypothetical protein n=1 Tax=Aurantiacibacter sp. MUD61 TaxID=3009083 RepID=UPI0022F0E534|nr:hypothetical protein [Aurantiacibacter sp. MUD61]
MDQDKLQSLRCAGALLAGSAVLAAVLMHYHPHGDDTSGMIRGVHGGLLALIVVQPAVLFLVARGLGWSLFTALAFAFFLFGTMGAVLAGAINGFVVPAVWGYPEGQIGPGVTQLAWELNQAFATLGAIAAGLGIALFGAALWQSGWRITAVLGLLAGAIPAALLIAGVIDMHFYGALWTYVTQLSWLTWLGVALYRAAGISSPSSP